MVLVGCGAWRRGAGGGRGARGGESGRDAPARRATHGGCVRAALPSRQLRAGAARSPGGREARLLRGHRRATLGRRRRARVQSLSRRDIADVSGRRLTALLTQHHAAAAVYRTTGR